MVFHRHGNPIKDYTTAWKLARTKAGLPNRVVHDRRRTAARNFRRADIPEHTAMMLTGHKTRHVFDRYDIVNETDLADAVSKLADAETTAQRMKAFEQKLAEQELELRLLKGEDEQAKFKQSQDVFGEVGDEWGSPNSLKDGAGGRNRTGTVLLAPRDFKSLASTNSATPALACGPPSIAPGEYQQERETVTPRLERFKQGEEATQDSTRENTTGLGRVNRRQAGRRGLRLQISSTPR